MANLDGAYPQSSVSSGRGVSLTRPESDFLTLLADPFSATDTTDLIAPGRACGLRTVDVEYIVEWVRNHGSHLLTCENAKLNATQGATVFRNPLVRRIINAAAERGYCLPTSAMKDEIEDFLSQQMRNPFVPDSLRESAAEKLSKLKGYTDTKSNGIASINRRRR